jgi:hypothetical protein
MVVAFSVTANYNVDAGAPADLSEGEGFPSDLRDAEWARLAPLIPPAHQQK